MTHEDFEKRVHEHIPELEILGEYVNSKTKILVRDKYGECMAYPTHIMRGL